MPEAILHNCMYSNAVFKAVKTAVKLFDDFCHKRWDELKAEASKEGMVLTSFLELVTDSRGDPGT